MSIEQADKVDAISTLNDEKVILTISDHLEWDENEQHLQFLQDKINAYLEFIESGQIYEHYPKANTAKVIIIVKLKFSPNMMALNFLNRCKTILLNVGIGFEWEFFKLKNSKNLFQIITTKT
ncbi:MAG: hypothetical protein QM541_07020 [Flavobacterium sp.]|nr:hypothetical protein [Flavobacterium sp.]